MLKKILIIGCGKMGISHLTSFLSKTGYKISIIDKSNVLTNLKKKYKKDNILFLSKIPKNLSYDFAIISTGSIERFAVTCRLLKYNKVRKLLLEKFIFQKKKIFMNLKNI